MPKVSPKNIGLVITRASRGSVPGVDVLLCHTFGGLPTIDLAPAEHPCEAAWRLAKATLGTGECVSYRALGEPDAQGLQWFQTACEDDLPELVFGPHGELLTWQTVTAASALPDVVKNALCT